MVTSAFAKSLDMLALMAFFVSLVVVAAATLLYFAERGASGCSCLRGGWAGASLGERGTARVCVLTSDNPLLALCWAVCVDCDCVVVRAHGVWQNLAACFRKHGARRPDARFAAAHRLSPCSAARNQARSSKKALARSSYQALSNRRAAAHQCLFPTPIRHQAPTTRLWATTSAIMRSTPGRTAVPSSAPLRASSPACGEAGGVQRATIGPYAYRWESRVWGPERMLQEQHVTKPRVPVRRRLPSPRSRAFFTPVPPGRGLPRMQVGHRDGYDGWVRRRRAHQRGRAHRGVRDHAGR